MSEGTKKGKWENMKRKILGAIWRLKYGDDIDILWPDDLVDMETTGISVYHRVNSIKDEYWTNSLGIKRMTRKEAEDMGGRPCEECFRRILPNLKKKSCGGEN